MRLTFDEFLALSPAQTMLLALERCPTEPEPIKDSAAYKAARERRKAEERAWLGG